MAKGLGSSGNSATLQRSKLSNAQKVTPTGPKLDDGMGGGGLGGKIFNGGGGDGGDDDDDDYFNEGEEEEGRGAGRGKPGGSREAPAWWRRERCRSGGRRLQNPHHGAHSSRRPQLTSPSPHYPPAGEDGGDGDGDGFFRKVFGELYDTASIQAVLQEWYKTMADLPLILRQAAQMGLFSSAALVRFMAMDVRPSVTRLVTRSLPPSVSGWLGGAAGWLAGWLRGLRERGFPRSAQRAAAGGGCSAGRRQAARPSRGQNPRKLTAPLPPPTSRSRARWWAG